ncbi:MAG: DEAD/DEAH box helicase, partial [Candidatus Xenobia bacterium]
MTDLLWPSTLRPFQLDGISVLMGADALLLADDMGLGKTVQCIAALRILLQRKTIGRVLIVTPASLLSQWRQELLHWAPEIKAVKVDGPIADRAWKWRIDKQVVLASYETVRSDSAAQQETWDVVVLDEAQRIKNRQTAVSRLCKRLRRHRSWALSGTPLENSVDELASILEFVRPSPEGGHAPLAGGHRLRARQDEVQLRRRKTDVLPELPPKTVVRLAVELGPAQDDSYRALERLGTSELSALGSDATAVNVLELITRLKQACNFCPRTGQSAKLDDLRHRLLRVQAQGDRALVFSQWKNPQYGVGRLAQELKAWRPLLYTGDVDPATRTAIIQRFQADPAPRILLLSLRAGGLGLNLQCASYVFHFDRWWNPAIENQATDRAHRLGQKNPVTVYVYTCVNTIEERIEAILDEKRRLFESMVDGISIDARRLLSEEDLFGLFGMEAPRKQKRSAVPALRLIDRVTMVLTRAGWNLQVRDTHIWGDFTDEYGDTLSLSAMVIEGRGDAD